jgi:hypothetical protein
MAGKQLGFRTSTAKSIVKKYRETGLFFMRSNMNQRTDTISDLPSE